MITSDSPGARAVVAGGTTGVVTPRGDVSELTRAAARLLTDDARRAAMGVGAREATRAWNTHAMVETIDRLLGEAAGSPAR